MTLFPRPAMSSISPVIKGTSCKDPSFLGISSHPSHVGHQKTLRDPISSYQEHPSSLLSPVHTHSLTVPEREGGCLSVGILIDAKCPYRLLFHVRISLWCSSLSRRCYSFRLCLQHSTICLCLGSSSTKSLAAVPLRILISCVNCYLWFALFTKVSITWCECTSIHILTVIRSSLSSLSSLPRPGGCRNWM